MRIINVLSSFDILATTSSTSYNKTFVKDSRITFFFEDHAEGNHCVRGIPSFSYY